tara:strand:+ start:13112 stop:13327 length:216 start_codon:yes stop_codon:yes gene_type:complete
MKRKVEMQAIHTQMNRSYFLEHSTLVHRAFSFVFEDSESLCACFAEEKKRYIKFGSPILKMVRFLKNLRGG